MKIIDAFLFSEPYEKEILLIKLILESKHIHEWILIENSYTFQGEYKGNFAQKIISTDSRFKPYEERIKIISGEIKFPGIDFSNTKREVLFPIDSQGLKAEYAQRELAREYIVENYGADDWVLISDTDEMLDFDSLDDNYKFLLDKLHGDLVTIPRIRYWYDFDNQWSELRGTPLVRVGCINKRTHDLGNYRRQTIGNKNNIKWERHLLYEYSFCFSKENIMRKYDTFTHPGVDLESVMLAISCNHLPTSTIREQNIDLSDKWWLKKVNLTESNSPRYIRENIEKIRTNTVDDNYNENRYIHYPLYFNKRLFSRAGLNRLTYYITSSVMTLRKKIGVVKRMLLSKGLN